MQKTYRSKYVRRKEEILRLRRSGKSYKQIRRILGCSLSTISYHCGKDSSEKKRVLKNVEERSGHISKKVNNFKSRCTKSKWRTFRCKVKTFKKKGKAKTSWRVHNLKENFSTADVVEKVGSTPICYLTGRKINLNKSETYSLDHRVPTAKGGTNDLSNLEICSTEANRAKADMSLKDFYKLCEEVIAWRDKCKNLNKPS